MAITPDTAFDERPAVRSVRAILSPTKLCVLAIVLAYLPLLIVHAQQMWRRPHYQFFPLFLAGIAAMLWIRLRRADAEYGFSRPRLLVASVVVALSVLLLVAAVILVSPWLAAISAMLLGGAALLGASAETRRELLPVWAALWLLIPPPFGLDQQLILSMQHGVAMTASEQLDLYGTNHLRMGTTLAFPDKQLLVGEACSGIRSLFALVACTALYAVWARLGILPVGLLIASAFFWAFVANVLRIICIAVAYDSSGIDLSTGWTHELLGLGVFTVAMGLAGSSAGLVLAMFSPIRMPVRELGVMHRAWNWLVAGRSVVPSDEQDDDYEQDELDYDEAELDYDKGELDDESLEDVPEPKPPTKLGPRFAWTAFAVFLALGGLQLLVMVADSSARTGPGIGHGIQVSEVVTESLLPAEQDGWKRVDFQIREWSTTSDSPHSNTWTYLCPNFVAIVSFDYPYDGFHDLSVCYRGIGWKQVDQRVEGDAGRRGSQSRWPYQVVEHVKPFEEHGFLLFSAFDAAGRPLDPPLSTSASVGGLLTRRFHKPGRFRDTYQVQLFVASDYPLSETEQAEVTSQFDRFRKIIRNRWMDGHDG